MIEAVANHREDVAALCRRYHVLRLDLFGSAARGGDFDPARSDLDFLVEFDRRSVTRNAFSDGVGATPVRPSTTRCVLRSGSGTIYLILETFARILVTCRGRL